MKQKLCPKCKFSNEKLASVELFSYFLPMSTRRERANKPIRQLNKQLATVYHYVSDSLRYRKLLF